MIDKIYEIKEYLFNKKYLIIIIIFIVLLIISIGTYFLINSNTKSNSSNDLELVVKKEEKEEKEDKKIEECIVDIKGYVINPNSYKIDCNYRVDDVIKIAGGLLENSDTSVINLSKKITDGMVIVIYSKEEVSNFTKTKQEETIKEEKCKNTSVVKNDACITKNERVDNENSIPKVEENTTTNNNTKEEDNTPKIISINTATKEELMTLKGIGESKALAIIQYREEHGLFNSIEDIKNIKGIGEKMFEKIKDFITL